MVMAMLSHPQNNELVKKALGIPELYIPGINDRTKQYREISYTDGTAASSKSTISTRC